jgi:hypothetical protein
VERRYRAKTMTSSILLMKAVLMKFICIVFGVTAMGMKLVISMGMHIEAITSKARALYNILYNWANRQVKGGELVNVQPNRSKAAEQPNL